MDVDIKNTGIYPSNWVSEGPAVILREKVVILPKVKS